MHFFATRLIPLYLCLTFNLPLCIFLPLSIQFTCFPPYLDVSSLYCLPTNKLFANNVYFVAAQFTTFDYIHIVVYLTTLLHVHCWDSQLRMFAGLVTAWLSFFLLNTCPTSRTIPILLYILSSSLQYLQLYIFLILFFRFKPLDCCWILSFARDVIGWKSIRRHYSVKRKWTIANAWSKEKPSDFVL